MIFSTKYTLKGVYGMLDEQIIKIVSNEIII